MCGKWTHNGLRKRHELSGGARRYYIPRMVVGRMEYAPDTRRVAIARVARGDMPRYRNVMDNSDTNQHIDYWNYRDPDATAQRRIDRSDRYMEFMDVKFPVVSTLPTLGQLENQGIAFRSAKFSRTPKRKKVKSMVWIKGVRQDPL